MLPNSVSAPSRTKKKKKKKKKQQWNHFKITAMKQRSLRKLAYSNILKILPPKHENFQIKNSDIVSYFCSKHRL